MPGRLRGEPLTVGLITHITPVTRWTGVKHEYRAPSLESEGFIHCSTPEQVTGPANGLFKGQDDLVLLCLDEAKLTARVIYEDCYDAGEVFPHVYGPINVDAVIEVVAFPCESDGSFVVPQRVMTLKQTLS